MAIVSYRADEIPPLSEAEKAHYKALAEAPDDEIDCSDIPEITDFSGFMNVEEFEAYRAAKRKKAQKGVTVAAL